MKDNILQIEDIGGKLIAVKGVGKMLYQEGVPLGITAKFLADKGVVVSWIHIADELLKESWMPDRIVARFVEELQDEKQDISIETIREFVTSDYDKQRSMIFNTIFPSLECARVFIKKEYIDIR